MGAHEDFMAVHRAALVMLGATDPTELATGVLLKAAATEISFIRLAKAGVQNEMIDLAWAVIGEPRPGGPAVVPVEEGAGG